MKRDTAYTIKKIIYSTSVKKALENEKKATITEVYRSPSVDILDSDRK